MAMEISYIYWIGWEDIGGPQHYDTRFQYFIARAAFNVEQQNPL